MAIPDIHRSQDKILPTRSGGKGLVPDVDPVDPSIDYVFKEIWITRLDNLSGNQEGIDPTMIIPGLSTLDNILRQWESTASAVNERRGQRGEKPLQLLQEKIHKVGETLHFQDTSNGSDIEIKVGEKDAIVTVKPLNGTVITVDEGKVVELPTNIPHTVVLTPGTADTRFPIVREFDGDLACATLLTWAPVQRRSTTIH